jgi:hypothetical protein
MSVKKLILLGGVLVLGAAWGLRQVWVSQTDLALSMKTTHSAPLPIQSAATIPSNVSSEPTSSLLSDWKEFQASFGQDLKATFYRGKLVAIEGQYGDAKRGPAGFSPRDSKQAIARAHELIQASAKMLKLNASFPLGHPMTRGSLNSAQVFFKETHQGLPLEPNGQVTVNLGPEGQLVALHANYAADVQIKNQRTLNEEEAQKKIPTQMAASPLSEGGRAIVWTSKTASGEEGRHAYEFYASGKQVIIDAQTGVVLSQRDSRRR